MLLRRDFFDRGRNSKPPALLLGSCLRCVCIHVSVMCGRAGVRACVRATHFAEKQKGSARSQQMSSSLNERKIVYVNDLHQSIAYVDDGDARNAVQ